MTKPTSEIEFVAGDLKTVFGTGNGASHRNMVNALARLSAVGCRTLSSEIIAGEHTLK